ncbi:MAG: hypothetical protein ABIA97_06715, partial [Candidatus Omnitrophota bacterium]
MVKTSINNHIKYFGIFIVIFALIQVCLVTIKLLFITGLSIVNIDLITNTIFLLTWIGLFIFGIAVLRFASWAPKLLFWLAIIAIPNNVVRV